MLFVFLTVALLGLFVEGSLQVFYRITAGSWLWDWWAIPIYEADAVRVYRLKANLDFEHKTSEFSARYLTDENGMRTDGRQPTPVNPKPKDTYRILAFGPSFAFGWGANYEDAYVHRLASGLKVPGKRVELVNLGTPAQPGCYQLKWLRETGYVYQPDLILQTVYGELDSLDNNDTLPENKPHVRNGYLYPVKDMTFALWLRQLRRYSAVLFYGWHVYHAAFSKDTAKSDGREFYKDIAGGTQPEDCVKRYQDYLDFVYRAVSNKPAVVFINVPLSWVVRPADVSRVSHHGGQLDPLRERERNAVLAGVLRSNQVNVIETTSALVEHDRETRMYHLYDIHFTIAGNKVLADHALPILQEIVQREEAGKQ